MYAFLVLPSVTSLMDLSVYCIYSYIKYLHYDPLMMSQKVAPKKNQKTCLIESGNDTFHASVYSSNVLCQINVVYACLFPAKLVS